ARTRPRPVAAFDERRRSAVHRAARREDDVPFDYRRRPRSGVQRRLHEPPHARLRGGAGRPRLSDSRRATEHRALPPHPPHAGDGPGGRGPRAPDAGDAFADRMSASSGYRAHPTATIDPGCTIGDGTAVWHYSHVMGGARIGAGCSLGQNVFIARDVVIGDNVKIQNNVSVYDGVTLEDDVFCGPSMVFTNVINP